MSRLPHLFAPLVFSLLFLLVASVPASWAQNGFNMPFSQFGVGESNISRNMAMANAMGGTILTGSGKNFINPANPASYAAVDIENFVLDMGFILRNNTLRYDDTRLNSFAGNFGYLAIAFPIFKFWKMSAGLMPYSDMNYQCSFTDTYPGGETVRSIYDGTGGTYRVFWGNAFNVTSNLSLGFNLNFIYGSITRALTYDFLESDINYYADARKQKNTRIRCFTFDIGAQYRAHIDDHNTLTFALTAQNPQTMHTYDTSWVYTLNNENAANIVVFPNGSDSAYWSRLVQPLSLGFGLAYDYDDKWRAALDVVYSQWSGLKYTEGLASPVFSEEGVAYVPNWRFAVGGGWLGDKDATSYWQRIALTGGLHFERASLAVQLDDGLYIINEFGGGFGLTFPMRKGRSQITVSFDFSTMGTTDVLRNNRFTIGISIGTCESWFVKRKYN